MTELVNYTSGSIQKLMSNIEQYRYNPSAIQRTILDYLDEITNGEVDIVDPTNPFVFLLESSSVNTAAAIQESLVNLRKQYASLAQTQEDLYLHMSDKDFNNRFSVPSETEFTFVIQVQDMYVKMVYDAVEKCGKLTIPRDTEFTVDDFTFTLQYPISIRKFDNGIVQVSYDTSISSPLQVLTSNIIDYVVRRDTNQLDWIFFKVPVSQFKIFTSYFPVQLSSMFSQNIQFTDQYYFCRVFYKNTSTLNKWSELMITHTDQVYDPLTPTAILKVFDNLLNVSIPKVYFTSGLVSGDIRIDIYSSKGELTVNLSNYKLTSFGTRLKAIDETRDINDYTNALLNTSYYVYSDQLVSGGTNGINFETMRERVLFNSIGDRQLPVTNTQLDAYVSNKGFDLVKNVDVITNRIFLATQKLPKPLNTKLLTSANIGIGTLITNLQKLSVLDGVRLNNLRQTILSNNIFKSNNGIIEPLTPLEQQALLALPKTEFISLVNSGYYLYNPFYYVLDNSTHEFEVRAYNLDYPIAKNLSFISQNQTLQLPVNTGQYNLEKIASGYKLTVVTKSGNFYKQLQDDLVQIQLAYLPDGEVNLAYINGTYVGLSNTNERIYEFVLETNYDLNKEHKLAITNSKMFSNETITNWIDLTANVHLFYTTTSLVVDYVADESDSMIGKFILPTGVGCVTHETLALDLGSSLGNLWTRCRTYATGMDYERYPNDIPMLYEQPVYQTDPITNSIFSFDQQGELVYTILHQVGDPVYDDQGEPVYKHRKGDIVTDASGSPVVATSLSSDRELDLLFVDGKYHFATDASFANYKSEIVAILDTWITQNLVEIQALLLEQTKIYFYPKTTIGMVKVFVDNNIEDMIASEQSLTVDLYVPSTVYNDNDIRTELSNITIKTIDTYINNSSINLTDIILKLKELYGESVRAVNISGLGGSRNYQVVNLAAEHNRLSLHKHLVQQQDGSMIIKEDVEINFISVV